MCFIAGTIGTMVMSAQGAVPIEAVRPGMEVWARDEVTKAEGWKPVVQTFRTHPEELFTLGYDTDGDGAADEELTGTGEHPFWVEDFGEFLPMRDLRPGMRLSLAREGATAIVTGNVSRRGPPGERFTTYNFEVAEYHTYFVGSAGVWVHNFSEALCHDAFTLFTGTQRKLDISDADLPGKRLDIVDEAWRITGPVPGNGPGHVLHALQRDEFADYATGKFGIDKLKSVKQQRAMLQSKGAGGLYDVHHVSERWLSERLGIPEGIWDDTPGMVLPKRPKTFGPHAANYRDTFGHDPIYHQGTLAEGSLVQKLRVIKRRYDSGELDKGTLLAEVRLLYLSEPYVNARMWPVLRDWLRAKVTDPLVIIPE